VGSSRDEYVLGRERGGGWHISKTAKYLFKGMELNLWKAARVDGNGTRLFTYTLLMIQGSGDLNSLNLLSLSLDERVDPGSSPLTRDYIYKVKDLLNRPSGHFPHHAPNP